MLLWGPGSPGHWQGLGTFLGVGASAQARGGAGPELRAALRSHAGLGIVGLPFPVVLGGVIGYISYVTLKETAGHTDCSLACAVTSGNISGLL